MAVGGVSFAVSPGETVGLVGPNGAGKTTILRCIGGIIRPTYGGIWVAGEDMGASARRAKC
ncbi:ATP-binding cassette domain-containing protein, partial [Citrobacter sp. AAK_AS5]